MLVGNTCLKYNAQGMLELSHFPGCSDQRFLTLDGKIANLKDFQGANCLCVNNGQNHSVQPWLHLIAGITVMAKQA